MLKMQTSNLVLYFLLILITFKLGLNSESVYNLTGYNILPTKLHSTKQRKPSSPRATFLTELLVFDRIFYNFPFGFYNKKSAYNSTKKESYVI